MKTNKIILTIRAAEGGMDSKLICEEMAAIYQKTAIVNSFECKVVD